MPKHQLSALLHTCVNSQRLGLNGRGGRKSFYQFISCCCLQQNHLQNCLAVCFMSDGEGETLETNPVHQSQEVRTKVCSDPGENAGPQQSNSSTHTLELPPEPSSQHEPPHSGPVKLIPNALLHCQVLRDLIFTAILQSRHHIPPFTGEAAEVL